MVLAIDLGTSATKLLAVSCEGLVLGRDRLPHETHHPVPKAAEQDPEIWWRNLGSGVRRLVRELDRNVAAIAVTGQMHGLVLHDERSRPLRPAITWQDRRSTVTLASLLDSIGASASISTGFQAASWHWLARAEPEVASRARRILLPKDEIIHRLTERHVTDPSDAVGTGWYDSIREEWNVAIVEAAGATVDLLPAIVPSGSVAGELSRDAAEHLGLQSGTPVVIAGGDAAVGAFGAGTTDPAKPLLMLSTGCQLVVPTEQPTQEPGCHLWPAATRPGLPPWLRVGATLNGGSAISWARATFEAGATPPQGTDPIFVPYLSGERFPVVRTGSAGAFFNIGPSHDSASLLRACIAGVALAAADALVTMGAEISSDAPLLVGGGGTRDEAWVAAVSRAVDRPLHIVAEPDLSARGAARLTAATTGWVDPVANPESWLPEIRTVDRPSGGTNEPSIRLDRYRRFARLVANAEEPSTS